MEKYLQFFLALKDLCRLVSLLKRVVDLCPARVIETNATLGFLTAVIPLITKCHVRLVFKV